jgi:hypothetical protein
LAADAGERLAFCFWYSEVFERASDVVGDVVPVRFFASLVCFEEWRYLVYVEVGEVRSPFRDGALLEVSECP